MLLIAYIIALSLSVVTFLVVVYEFMHIHHKRLHLLGELGGVDARFLLRGRKRAIILYAASIIAVFVISSSQLFL